MKMLHKLRVLCQVCAGVFLINLTVNAAPVQTFSGLLSIGDAANGISNLVGTNFSIDGDGVFDLNLAYGGSNINSIFGWNANAREASPGSALIITTTGNEAKLFLAGETIGSGGTTVADALLGSADTFGGATGVPKLLKRVNSAMISRDSAG